MATLLDEPLRALIDDPGVADISPDAAALVVRFTNLVYRVAGRAPAAAVLKALARGSEAALIADLASLLVASGARRSDTPDCTAETLLRGSVTIASLVEQTGGLLRPDEAQRTLAVTRTALQQWRSGRRVLALPLGDGSFGYPVAQFARPASDLEPPRPYEGLPDVLAAAGDALTPAELFALLATPQPAWADASGTARTGFEALATGRSDVVVALVRHVATPADADAPAA